jgi:hypothetical protein
MSKKIVLHITGRRFDVDVEEEFALFLEKEIEKDFDKEGNKTIKDLLQAYVRKTHALYQQNKKIEKMNQEIEERLQF